MLKSAGLAVLAAILTGCGPIAAGVLVASRSSSSGGGIANTPASLALAAPVTSAASASGEIAVPFTIRDGESDAVNVIVEFALPGGGFQAASARPGSPSLTGLASSPAGTDQTFVWDSRKDLGPRDVSGVVLRFSSFDAGGQGTPVSRTFDIRNNEAPTAAILRLSPGNGVAFVDYLLADSNADTASVLVEFSLDGTTFRPASRAAGQNDQGTTNLATSVSGRVYSFAWNSALDAPGARSGNVFLRVTPTDAAGGSPAALGGLAIDNSQAPVIANISVAPVVPGGTLLEVTFDVSDTESDPSAVSFAFSSDGSAFQTVTVGVTPVGSVSLSALPTSPGGNTHALRWDAAATGLGQHTVVIRLTPSDTRPGSPVLSAPITVLVQGDQPATATFAPIARQFATPTTFDVTVRDPEGANVRIVGFDLDRGDGLGFVASATILSPALPATVTSAGGAGVTVSVAWDAVADLGPGARTNVRLRVQLLDLGGAGAASSAASAPFLFGNTAPTITAIVTPPSPQSRNVPVTITIADTTSDTTNLRDARFGTDVLVRWTDLRTGAITTQVAILAAGTVQGLPTSQAGTPQLLVWDSAATIGSRDALVQFLVRPADVPAPGAGDLGAQVASAPFTVLNDSPPSAFVIEPTSNDETDGALTITFTVRDDEAGPADVILQWASDSNAFLGDNRYDVTDLLADAALRRRVLDDPDERAARRIITPRLRVIAEGCAMAPIASNVVGLAAIRPSIAITASSCVGATLELLSPTGAVEVARTIVAADPLTRRVTLGEDLVPAPGQRVRIVESAARLFVGLPTTFLGVPYRVSWDVPRDVGIVEGTAKYFLRAVAAEANRGGIPTTTLVGKTVVTDRFALAPPIGVPADGSPSFLRAADLNGDGIIDIVCRDSVPQLSIFLGRKDGTFARPTPAALAATGDGKFAIADLDGDGKLDIASDESTDQLRIFIGNGDGTFATRPLVPTSAGDSPTSIGVGDFDGDGRLDLAVTAGARARLRLFRGNGDGTFQSPAFQSLVTGSGPLSLAVGDFNGDARPDVVTADQTASGLSVYVGTAGGMLAPAGGLFTGGFPSFVTVDDLDRDGRLDIVSVADSSQLVSVFLGNGDATFRGRPALSVGLSPFYVTTGDVNGDGIPDVLTTDSNSRQCSIYLGRGDGTFVRPASPVLASSSRTGSVLAVDVNGDGTSDLVVAEFDLARLAVHLGIPDGTGVTRPTPPGVSSGLALGSVMTADFDGDGILDFVDHSTFGGGTGIFLGVGDGTFNPKPRFVGGVHAIGDLDGDGRLDLVVAAAGAVRIFLGNGDGTFREVAGLPAGTQPELEDLDADGILDLVVASGSVVAIYRGRGDGSFQSLGTFATGPSANRPVLADLDANGTIDLITPDGGGLSLFLGQGDGSFVANGVLATTGLANSVVVADVNGDGHVDLVSAGQATRVIELFLGTGGGAFGPRRGISSGIEGASLEVRDLDGNGTLDIVVNDFPGGLHRVLLGAGDGTFTRAVPIQPVATIVSGLLVADINGDGSLDVAWAGGNARDEVFLNSRRGPLPARSFGSRRVRGATVGTGRGGALVLGAGSHTIDTTAGIIDGVLSPARIGGAFHFTSVDVASGAFVRVIGEEPLVLLATGSVTIAGTIACDGSSAADAPSIAGRSSGTAGAPGGPGAGAGGNGAGFPVEGSGIGLRGQGPGGGGGGGPFGVIGASGGGGGFAGAGMAPMGTSPGFGYGNAVASPLHGGSGGGGGGAADRDMSGTLNQGDAGGGGGGGGGGAIRITAGGNISVAPSGRIAANGGNGGAGNAGDGGGGGGGSGGTILLQARGRIDIAGVLSATGGQGAGVAGDGAPGRVRFEARDTTSSVSATGSVSPAPGRGLYPGPQVEAIPATIVAGATVSVTATGFTPGSPVDVLRGTVGTGTLVATLASDASGSLATTVPIPAGTPAGPVIVTLVDVATGEVAVAVVTVR